MQKPVLRLGAVAALCLVATSPFGAAIAAERPSPPPDKFRWPVRGPILQPYKAGETNGIDIKTRIGEPVHAAAEGVCIYAGEMKPFGKLILIRHANDYVTAYGDNSELLVKDGDKVKRGQIIAKSGDSGDAASPRLHFEIRKNSKPVDPTKYLAPH